MYPPTRAPPPTYDYRLERIGHPVRSAIHKLVIQWLNALNRANRHSAESEPLAALRGEPRGEQGGYGWMDGWMDGDIRLLDE